MLPKLLSCAIVGAFVLASCAQPGDDIEVSVSIAWPFTAALTCDNASNLDGMTAELHVGGNYPVCELEVAADHSASGRCTGYRTGEELPLLVVYRMAEHGAILAIALGSADLRETVLPEGEETFDAAISLDAEDLVYQQFMFDGWVPAAGCVTPEGGTTEARGRAWAWCYVDGHPNLFDGRDADRLFLCRNPAPPPPIASDPALVLACSAAGLTSCLPPE